MGQNLASLIESAMLRFQEHPAFASRGNQKAFHEVSFQQLHEQVTALGCALIELGLAPRDHVALFADNRFEWIVSDLAVIFCGAADVPRGSDITDTEICYILSHSNARFAIVENQALLMKLQQNASAYPSLEGIVVMESQDTPAIETIDGRIRVFDFTTLCQRGEEIRSETQTELAKRIAGIEPDDLFTLIYTSGTTGAPKGVQLSHKNIVSQIERNPFRITPKDKILSILPVWHIFERVFEMFAIVNGCCTYYTNVRSLREDLAIVKPTFMASAPRLWESIYTGIMNNVAKAPPLRRALFESARKTAAMYRGSLRFLAFRDLAMTPRPFFVSLARAVLALVTVVVLVVPFTLLDWIVLRKIRKATGGRLRGSVSGGGALPLHIDQFFNDIGIPVLEGYGLTETSPVLAVRTFNNLVIGTVGPLYPGTELRLVDLHTGADVYPPRNGARVEKGKSGEIHVRGPQVMKGYYKNPDATSKVMSDGWFNTGDLGIMTANGCLKIVGRSKDTVVLLGGENVEPVPIENRLLESPLIDQCMIVGQDQRYLGALIVPARERFNATDVAQLAESVEVRRAIGAEIKRLVSAESGFKGFERVVDFRILPKPFELGDELTAKLSLKRHVVAEKYKAVISSMYT